MASSASPAILPISNSQPAAGVTSTVDVVVTAQPAAPVATLALRLFRLFRFQESFLRCLSDCRPWSKLFDPSAFSRPESLTVAYSRVHKNFSYFRVNYLALIAAVLALSSLITAPFSLALLLLLLAYWCVFYLFRPSDSPLILYGHTLSDGETLLGLSSLTVFVVFLTPVGSLIISAFMIGAALVAAHGAFRVPDDLLLDDQIPGGAATAFLSFLGEGASSGGAANVLSRV